jgi:tRNA nucleotidyltransferase (CCA-adding enzyme)
MHIILSHEQGDFDSLGAMLGASLIFEKAVPLLQHRQNLNVRAFLNLYLADLPFCDPRHIPDEGVETLTVVDAQSMPGIKGISQKTSVTVIDHHSKRPDLPSEWKVTIDCVGACTTLFVEQIQNQLVDLTPIQATLLLLGIYEDTGSLTYENTTPRDLHASAYLLEKGASLRIANKYLNPPLSDDQQKLYDSLLACVETHKIHGMNVLVACGDAGTMTDEVSSIAHKMRDLLDPDALFILVNTLEGIRLVARSSSEQINVASVAAHFGGGGHGRAASALVHPRPARDQAATSVLTASIREELLRILQSISQPAITIGQIMSRRPLILSPLTSAEEAALLMTRYGYEGYPVVQDDKIVGLLTRRAVDRSLAHKLNLSAGSLMHAGEASVQPGDSLDHLQKVMTSSGWGQIPVVDPEDKKVIGIVTRTDLFRCISGGKTLLPNQETLVERLKVALPPARMGFLKMIAEIAHVRHQAIYIVGGFVRDLLLNRPCVDFDLVVEGNAIDLAYALEERFGGRVISHKRFGTAKWSITDIRPQITSHIQQQPDLNASADLPASLDLISARTEFYDYPTALPTVERGNIKLDLRRRDFSINTLALRLDGHHYGELVDFWGGYNDLRQGTIRVLHSLSLIDDPTRILRAIRFEQRFNFQIEPRTFQLMEEARPLLGKVSGQRLRHELDLTLSEENACAMFFRLNQFKFLQSIHPALNWNQTDADALIRAQEAPAAFWEVPDYFAGLPSGVAAAYLVWLSGSQADTIGDISKRLRFSQKLNKALQDCCHLRQELPAFVTKPRSEIVHHLKGISPIVLFALNCLGFGQGIEALLVNYLTEWRHVRPTMDGKSLRSLGIQPGPIYQQVLSRLQDAWLDGTVSSAGEEKLLVEKTLSAINGKVGK